MCQKLSNPPIVAALAQLRFKIPNFKIDSILKYDGVLKESFPIRQNNIQVGIDLGKTSIPLGESRVSGVSTAEVGSYVYISQDQKTRLKISEDSLTYVDEKPYAGWESFKESLLKILNILSPVFEAAEVERVSIRFVNRLVFKEFDDPKKYVNTLITSSDGLSSYPLRQYGFRLTMDVPNTDIYTVVNHNVEDVPQNQVVYMLDIDVLDKQKTIFDVETIGACLDGLRLIRNKIFFDTLTHNTIQLCNSHE